jgi:hypothetical protein
MVNKQMYQEVLERLRKAVRKKKLDYGETRRILHHKHFVGLRDAPLPPHQICFPDLPTADFFLFPKLQTTLKECFQIIVVIHEIGVREPRDQRKCVTGSIPTMEEILGTVYRP